MSSYLRIHSCYITLLRIYKVVHNYYCEKGKKKRHSMHSLRYWVIPVLAIVILHAEGTTVSGYIKMHLLALRDA